MRNQFLSRLLCTLLTLLTILFSIASDSFAIVPGQKMDCPTQASQYKCPAAIPTQKFPSNATCIGAANDACRGYLNACESVSTSTSFQCAEPPAPTEMSCRPCPGKKDIKIECKCEDKVKLLRFRGIDQAIEVPYQECAVTAMQVSCTTNYCLETPNYPMLQCPPIA